ncbi:hypothetical protein BC938DRAFT_477515 [Jimgerdemannia flammicorona]|uniref:Uncharacterized protein n=1 Tax=Jimgerdemannia flammicorona TaxID=994334 RepID=A0A433QYY2_9FUNG|nr:hypothetical protein BC938DRAFT_477515 [Jimgerdemannia flammicorona]
MTTNPEQDILTLLTIPPPPTPPSPTTTSSHYSSHFQRIAHHLLFHHHLHLSTRRYTLLEVEFYVRDASSCHLDPFTHGHPDQLRRGTWYFHRVGMSEGFKGGTRKGLDVTIGDEARAVRGGILIRAMREVDGARKVVEGPSLVCDRILEELGARTVKELVEETWEGKVEVWNREGGLWIEKVDGEEGCGCECAEEGGDTAAEKDEDKSSSAAQAANEAVDEAADNTATKASASTSTSTRKRSRSDITTTTTTTTDPASFIVKRLKPTGIPTTRRNPHPPLHTSSRVGLTLTNVTPTTRSRLEPAASRAGDAERRVPSEEGGGRNGGGGDGDGGMEEGHGGGEEKGKAGAQGVCWEEGRGGGEVGGKDLWSREVVGDGDDGEGSGGEILNGAVGVLLHCALAPSRLTLIIAGHVSGNKAQLHTAKRHNYVKSNHRSRRESSTSPSTSEMERVLANGGITRLSGRAYRVSPGPCSRPCPAPGLGQH